MLAAWVDQNGWSSPPLLIDRLSVSCDHNYYAKLLRFYYSNLYYKLREYFLILLKLNIDKA